MLLYFTIIVSAVFCVFLFIHSLYSLREVKDHLNEKAVNLETNPSDFSLIRKFLKRLYSNDFEIDTFGSRGFATWGTIIKFYSKDGCSHLDIKLEYASTYSWDSSNNSSKETRVLRGIYVCFLDDQLHSDTNEYILDVDFMKCVDSRSEKYIQVKKPYKFVEYIDKNFKTFEIRKRQKLEAERMKEEELEREKIKRKLACV